MTEYTEECRKESQEQCVMEYTVNAGKNRNSEMSLDMPLSKSDHHEILGEFYFDLIYLVPIK